MPSHSEHQSIPATDGLPSRGELIGLMAMLAATIAFSIDAMLPALPAMAEALTPEAPNRAQLVVTVFVFGLGLGTLFTGPLSDTFGRKPVMLMGTAIYIVSAALATQAESLELLLFARAMQGVGAAGPRVVAIAVIRDLFAGRQMAQIVSFIMMVFTIVPAVAPSIGALMLQLGGWPLIFWTFVVFAALSGCWLWLRLPETLPLAARRPFRVRALRAAAAEMLQNPVVRLSILVQCLVFAMLFATVSTVQPIYDVLFDRGDSFPLWMGATALLAASGSLVNAMLVLRLGMRRLVSLMLQVQIGISGLLLAAQIAGLQGDGLFALFFFWQFLAFFQAGLTIGNLNAIAMEPMGHIAGMAASVIGAIATVAGALLAAPIGLMFDGTARPLAFGVMLLAVAGVVLMRAMRRAESALDPV